MTAAASIRPPPTVPLVVRWYGGVAHSRLPSDLRLRDIHAALSTVAGSAWEIHGVDEWDEGGE
jgi:hypothetical protein